MPTQLTKPSIQFVVLLVGIVLLVGFGVGISSAGLTSNGPIDETAQLDVDGVIYHFAPTTCTITDDDFLAAGSGSIDGQPFWVSASRDRVDLAVGPESEVERPEADQLWLISVDQIRWQAEETSITATAVMHDERDTNAEHFTGALSVDCPTV